MRRVRARPGTRQVLRPQGAARIQARSRSSRDRSHSVRLRSFTLAIWPSTLPVLHSCSTPAVTALKSAVSVLANLLKEGNGLAEACSIHRVGSPARVHEG